MKYFIPRACMVFISIAVQTNAAMSFGEVIMSWHESVNFEAINQEQLISHSKLLEAHMLSNVASVVSSVVQKYYEIGGYEIDAYLIDQYSRKIKELFEFEINGKELSAFPALENLLASRVFEDGFSQMVIEDESIEEKIVWLMQFVNHATMPVLNEKLRAESIKLGGEKHNCSAIICEVSDLFALYSKQIQEGMFACISGNTSDGGTPERDSSLDSLGSPCITPRSINSDELLAIWKSADI